MLTALNLTADPDLQQALTDLVQGFAPEGVCEVCHKHDDTVSCLCGAQYLAQLCEHCHWATCPHGGECW